MKRAKKIKKKSQQGMTLIELMVGLAVGLIIMLGLLQISGHVRQSYKFTVNVTEVTQNINFLLTTLSNTISYAGHRSPVTPVFVGCYKDCTSCWGTNSSRSFAYYRNTDISSCANYLSSQKIYTFGMQFYGAECWFGNQGDPFRYGWMPDTNCGWPPTPMGTDWDNAIYVLRGRYVAPVFNSSPSGSSGSDILRIRYQGEGDTSTTNIKDCQGNPVDRNTVVENAFYIVTDPTTKIPYLACTVSTVDAAGNISRNGAEQRLVAGVEAMRVIFGVDTDGDGVVNQYVAGPLSNTTAAKTVGVQVALLMRTQEEVATITDTTKYNLLNNIHGPYNDKRLRRLYTMTLRSNECLPAFRQDCQGADVITQDWQGNLSTTQMKSNDKHVIRVSGQDSSGCGIFPYISKSWCSMDAQGNLTAGFRDRCGWSDVWGNTIPYGDTSNSSSVTVNGQTTVCKFQ